MNLLALLLTSATAAQAQAQDIPSCGEGKPACPEKYPCCSVDGTCGNGYVCLGGCDPRFSFQPGACMPMPACKSGKTDFSSADQITPYADYLGDADKQPWSYLGNITAVDGKLRTQLFPGTGGTTISSSNYVLYGKVSLTCRTSHGAGVISDFILLSGVKDEVDYEFVGNNVNQAQTNYYWQGNLDYTKMQPAGVADTYANAHTYTIDWKPDAIQWIIDGNVVRTLNRQDTFNPQTNSYGFPQTPARIQFGLWPGGDSPAQGTSAWAGGRINWNAPDLTDPGYYFVEVYSVEVECYTPPSDVEVAGSSAYVYTDKTGLGKNVKITDDNTVLGSTDGTGLNPEGSKKQQESSSIKPAHSLSGVVAKSSTTSTKSSEPSTTEALLTLSGASSAASSNSSIFSLSTVAKLTISNSSLPEPTTVSSSNSYHSNASLPMSTQEVIAVLNSSTWSAQPTSTRHASTTAQMSSATEISASVTAHMNAAARFLPTLLSLAMPLLLAL